jgi:sugar-specific transcriptional regulator TrmB
MSPQSQHLYQVLLNSNRALSANQLAQKLDIVPNSIYRLTDPLTDMGLITRSEKYPYLFSANPVEEAHSLFLLFQSDWFLDHFSKTNTHNPLISFSFIKSRDELMNVSIKEVDKANESIDLLRSGGEFPAELLLAIINAKKRGVPTRMLIQDYSSENTDLVKNWKANGIQVRLTSLRHIRLMIYDSKVVYFMSYRNTDSEKDLGLKINYSPLAAILTHQFKDWWKNARKL